MPKSVRFVDLTSNRLGLDQVSALVELLKTVAERRGAVVVWGNHIASSDAQPFFEELATTDPALFLRLIWIPETWIDGRRWSGMLGKCEAAMVDKVHQAHATYYQLYKQLTSKLPILNYL